MYDPTGAALAGAEVAAYAAEPTPHATRAGSPPIRGASRCTGAGGRSSRRRTSAAASRSSPPPAGSCWWRRARGHVPAQRPVLPGDEEISLTLERAVAFDGRVTSDGEPVGGAVVVWPRRDDHAVVATTGPDGGFTARSGVRAG